LEKTSSSNSQEANPTPMSEIKMGTSIFFIVLRFRK